jgi:hypothetical protein
MVRKPNYDQDKRRKEQERKAKKDAKRADRLQRREEQSADAPPEDIPQADGADVPLNETRDGAT